MSKKIYKNSINVLKGNHLGRDLNVGTYIENGSGALFDINTIAYSDLIRIQKNLNEVLSGNIKYDYEWSGMRYCFESSSESTTIEDSVFGADIEDVKTDTINELIVNRIKYLNTLSKSLLLKKVKCGFDTIKRKPSDFRLEEFRYKIDLTDESLFLILLEEDFDLSSDEFISTIKIKDILLESDSSDQPA